MADDTHVDDEIITCWCGVKGKYDELFDDECYDRGCGGTGTLYCECGGDICVCHHHGQDIECPGCGDCQDADGNEIDWDEFEPDYPV